MSGTASDFLIQRLSEWGVSRVYGYPGDGINGILGALGRQEKVSFFQTRHEEIAAFMACAHAKFTGEVGVCMATSGPGAIHLLNGLYDAKLDHQPVVAIVGQQKTIGLGGEFQQEVDLISLFKDVANTYDHMASSPVQIRHLVDRAFRIAKSERTVTCIIVPADVQEKKAVPTPPDIHGATISGVGFSHGQTVPSDTDLSRAARVLNEAKRVAILIGAGAADAAHRVEAAADILGAGVAKALLGKTVLPDDLPYVTGSIGLLGTKPSWDLMMGCDALLMIGSSFPYSEYLPKPGQAKGVQIDILPRMLSLRFPMEVNLHGDSALTLEKLIPLLERKTDRSWQEKIMAEVGEWWGVLESRAHHKSSPLNPQLLFWELSKRLPHNSILTSDSGSAANWYARDVKVHNGMMASLSGGLATMCPGVPYALAAKVNHPERPVIALVGDGAMQMLGNAALIDVKHHYKKWKDPRLAVLVLNNRDLNQVTWEQRVLAGDPKYRSSQDLPSFNYAQYARMLGLEGIEVTKPSQVGPAWDRALSADRPVVIDAHTDPDVPPLPPHLTYDQAKAYVSSIVKGDPDRIGILTQSTKEVLSTLTAPKQETKPK
ncbi:MAG: thiamine pyrophosphate-requiring protein [Chitinispirillaceae bacterium]